MSDPNDEFYILSLKWTRGDLVTWWAPNNSGYTTVLERAGRYSKADVDAEAGYYNDGVNTMAIPCEVVEKHAQRVVMADSLTKLIGKHVKVCTECGVGLAIVKE
jgi:hypothetical protein